MADPVTFVIMEAITLGISYLFPSEGPRTKDLRISASTYGAQIPNTFGTTRVPGNMIWSDKIREHKRESLNGKGGFSNTYKYSCAFAMGLCAGPVASLSRIWADNKLIYDMTGASGITIDNTKYRIKFYNGSEDQVPNATMQSFLGEANTPAFRGLAYLFFDNIPLDDFSNRIPQITAEVYRQDDGMGTAPKIAITQHGGGALSNYQADNFNVDVNRGFGYVKRIEADNTTSLLRFRLSDGVMDKVITKADFAFPNTLAGRDNQDLWAVVGVSPTTGRLIVIHGFGNNVPVDLLDANSYRTLATSGVANPFDGIYAPPSGGQIENAFSTNTFGEEYCAWRSLFAGIYVIDTNPLNFGGGFVDQIGSFYEGSCICGTNGLPDAGFYVAKGGFADGSLTTNIILYKLGTAFTSALLEPTSTVAVIENPETPGVPDEFFAVTRVAWDDSDPGVLVFFHTFAFNYLAKWSHTTGKIVWTRKVPQGFDASATILNGQLVSLTPLGVADLRLWVLDAKTGRWVDKFSPPTALDPIDETNDDILGTSQDDYEGIPTGVTAAFGGTQFYDSTRNVLVTIGGLAASPPSIYHVGAQSGATTLESIVESLLRLGGLTNRFMDMSALGSTVVQGYGWATATDVKSILDELRRVYQFDIVETSGKLVGVMRGDGSNFDDPGAIVDTIVQNALGSSSPEASDFWQETRTQEAELPERVSLSYMNFSNDYQTSIAISERISNPLPAMFSRQQVAMQVSVVMTPSEAKNRVARALYTQWAERVHHQTRLPWSYLNLDPADLIQVTMNDGRTYFERLHSEEIGADYNITAQTYGQDSGAYVSNLPADGGGTPTIPIFTPRVAQPFVVNTPLLRDGDDSGGSYSVYYAGIGNNSSESFQGGAMFRSTDPRNYMELFVTDTDVEFGSIEGIVPGPRHGWYALDWETKIKVWGAATTFELESITDDELWAGDNACMVGNEIIQFRDAVQNSDGSWTLSNLLRGRRGTEYACDNHVIGEFFVFLDGHTILKQGDVLDSRGQARYFKAVAEQQAVVNGTPLNITYEPRDLMPYAPADIRRTVSGGAITVDWSRRTRMGGNLMDFTGDVPLQEVAEKYEVYLLKTAFDGDLSRGQAPTDFVFSATTTDPTVTWTPGSTAVFDVNLDTLTVVVYQISAAVGRGFPGVRSIEPWDDF
jgi:hypothetical protein